MTTKPPFTQRLLDILDERREEISKTVKEARRVYSKFNELLEVKELELDSPDFATRKLTPTQERMANELEYLLDLFDTYVSMDYPREGKRNILDEISEDYQQSPDDVKKVLDYFELPL